MSKTNIDRVREMLGRDAAFASGKLEAWRKKLDVNPACAFEWSDDAFRAAASGEVCAWALGLLEKAEDLDDLTPLATLLRHLTAELSRNARFPSRSTSRASNEMATCLMVARAELLEKLERYTKEELS